MQSQKYYATRDYNIASQADQHTGDLCENRESKDTIAKNT
jgi:hypothetical protein